MSGISNIPQNSPPPLSSADATEKTGKKRSIEGGDAQGESKKAKIEKKAKKLLNDTVNPEHHQRSGKKRSISLSSNEGDGDNTTKKVRGVRIKSSHQKGPSPLEKLRLLCNSKSMDQAADLIRNNPTLIEQIEVKYLPIFFEIWCKNGSCDLACQLLEQRTMSIVDIHDNKLLDQLFNTANSLHLDKAASKVISHQNGWMIVEKICNNKNFELAMSCIHMGADVAHISRKSAIQILEHIAEHLADMEAPKSWVHLQILDKHKIFVGENEKIDQLIDGFFANLHLASVEDLQIAEAYGLPRIAFLMLESSDKLRLEDIKDMTFKEQILKKAAEVGEITEIKPDIYTHRTSDLIINLMKNKVIYSAHTLNKILYIACKFDAQDQEKLANYLLQEGVLNKKRLSQFFWLACNLNRATFALKVLKADHFDINISLNHRLNAGSLSKARNASNWHLLRLLVEKGADLTIDRRPWDIDVLRKELSLIEYMQLANTNSTLCERTPSAVWPPDALKIAEEHGLANVAYWLIARDEFVFTDIQDTNFREKILEIAISADYTKCIDWIITKQVSYEKITDKNIVAMLIVMLILDAKKNNTFNKRFKIIDKIIREKDFNANFNLVQKCRDTKSFAHPSRESPLLAAVLAGNLIWVQYLITHKHANVNRQYKNISPLACACELSQEAIAIYLLGEGASPKCQIPRSGEMLLHGVIHRNLFAFANMLLSRPEIDVVVKGKTGQPPFQSILNNGNDTPTSMAFLEKYFKTNRAIVVALNKKKPSEISSFFNEYPGKLLQSQDEGANPLEWPFLFQDIALAKKIVSFIKKIDLDKVQLDLEKKFPGSVESIREFFYKTTYTVDPHHYAQVVDVSTPKIHDESIEKPKLSQYLLDLFDKINFNDPSKAFYINPRTIFRSQEETAQSLRKTFEVFLKKIKDHEAYLGTPYATIGNPPVRNPAVDLFYNTIEEALYHVAITIQKIKDPDKAREIIESFISDLLKASPYCGGRIYSDSMRQYKLAVLGRKEAYEEQLVETLANMRQNILESLMPTGDAGGQSTHIYTACMRDFGAEFGIIGTKAFTDFDDRLATKNAQVIANIKQKFLAQCNSVQIIDWVRTDIKQIELFRYAFIDWLKKNIPPEFMDKNYKAIEQEFHTVFSTSELDEPFFENMQQPIAGDERVIEFFASKNIDIAQSDKTITPAQAIADDGVQEYLGYILNPSNERYFIDRVIDSLIQQQVLEIN